MLHMRNLGIIFLLLLFFITIEIVRAEEKNFSPALVKMESWAPYYRPFTVTIQSHTPIQWNNPTASSHTVRHDGCAQKGLCLFDSGAVPPNGSYTIAGLEPGRYPYHCELHPIMRGELIVGGQAIEMKKELEQVAHSKQMAQ